MVLGDAERPEVRSYAQDPSGFVYDNDNNYNIAKHEDSRIKHGLSYADWFNFDSYIAFVIANWADMHIRHRTGHPAKMTNEEWGGLLVEMRDGFAQYANANMVADDPDIDKVNRALEIFKEHFFHLWD